MLVGAGLAQRLKPREGEGWRSHGAQGHPILWHVLVGREEMLTRASSPGLGISWPDKKALLRAER